MTITRRGFAASAFAGLASTALGGCELFRQPLMPICGYDPSIIDLKGLLTIDAHTHVFNGTDLQVEAFMRLALGIPGVGTLLQGFTWSGAPTARDEFAVLERLADRFRSCSQDQHDALVASLAEDQYQVGKAQLQRLANRRRAGMLLRDPAAAGILEDIRYLPNSYKEFKEQRKRRARLLSASAGGALEFLLRGFQYRYVNVMEYLTDYGQSRDRKVDLLVAHLVDYDWPIAGGRETLTPLPEQIDVMSRISALTFGRVHCFVPFDPFKQVAFDRGLARYSPLELVSRAINQSGFIGVKLYPPMGFRPYGNALVPPAAWDKPWIPATMKTPDLGRRLDDAMGRLIDWCVDNDVPIMGHTAPSNSPQHAYENFTDAAWWEYALRRATDNRAPGSRGLRVDFGHFGASDIVSSDRAEGFARLMTKDATGNMVYADSGYFSEVLGQQPAMRERLRGLFKKTANKQNAALAQRLMYGTDWLMVIIEGSDIKTYLSKFEDVFAALDRDATLGAEGQLSRQFFGANAARFLGLHQGERNRQRLSSFYGANGIRSSVLFGKVDALRSTV